MENNGNHKVERIYIDPLMRFYIEGETKKLAEELKKKHGLQQVNIPLISGSQWLANKLLHNKAMIRYRIKMTSLNVGEIEFL